MTANPILLQKKYARIIEQFSKKEKLSFDDALNFFYRSTVYRLISLAEELISEYEENHLI